jgi:hypothetical protein
MAKTFSHLMMAVGSHWLEVIKLFMVVHLLKQFTMSRMDIRAAEEIALWLK